MHGLKFLDPVTRPDTTQYRTTDQTQPNPRILGWTRPDPTQPHSNRRQFCSCALIISKCRLLFCHVKINTNMRHKSEHSVNIKLSSFTRGSSSQLASRVGLYYYTISTASTLSADSWNRPGHLSPGSRDIVKTQQLRIITKTSKCELRDISRPTLRSSGIAIGNFSGGSKFRESFPPLSFPSLLFPFLPFPSLSLSSSPPLPLPLPVSLSSLRLEVGSLKSS